MGRARGALRFATSLIVLWQDSAAAPSQGAQDAIEGMLCACSARGVGIARPQWPVGYRRR
jgi:xanthine dehydrogenase iron-sulfur cluster and FAD-binding subunit A